METIKERLSSVKALLAEIVLNFSKVTTLDGQILSIDGEEIKEGAAVMVVDAEGNETVAPDGAYETESAKFTIKDGVIETVEQAVESPIVDETKVEPNVEAEAEEAEAEESEEAEETVIVEVEVPAEEVETVEEAIEEVVEDAEVTVAEAEAEEELEEEAVDPKDEEIAALKERIAELEAEIAELKESKESESVEEVFNRVENTKDTKVNKALKYFQ